MRTLCTMACALLTAVVPARAGAASCHFSSSGIAFGAYDPTAATTVRGAGSIDYHCSSSTAAVIAIDGGASKDVNARRMASGTERLAYNVYKNSSGTDVWGDTLGTGLWVTLGKRGSIPIYGVMAPHQDAAAGAYADTLTVTVVFF